VARETAQAGFSGARHSLASNKTNKPFKGHLNINKGTQNEKDRKRTRGNGRSLGTRILLSVYGAMLRPGGWGLHCALSTC
jgi:hypothetical protein